MNRNYFFAILGLALGCLFLIIISMWRDSSRPASEEKFVLRPKSPYKSYISAPGVVEASSGNIFIGTPVNRIVDNIPVAEGKVVKKGDVLLQLENRDLEAQLISQQIAYKSALANFEKLQGLPRPEDLTAAESALKIAQVNLTQAKSQYEMVQALYDSRALSQEAINQRLYAFQQAEARGQQAQAGFDKIKAGTWKPDLEIARLEVMQAKANFKRAKADFDRTTIRSPIDATILQIKIHEGEMTPSDTTNSPIMIIGNTDELYLRVAINQLDAPFFKKKAPAVAFLQGDAHLEFPLEFVRIEPYLTDKQNLTNNLTDTVDTRVLQVVYRFNKGNHNLYVGQQMDVFIEAEYTQ